ncbi:hypothetical protein Mal4_12640 [Maioricimonas rarisocia]|uniref:Uncharacterized protein n=1 Tax=Maioricimonas rarisocia TaxID=2528026 RepID=A0A517Z3B3_9PLAN|nr:hypothetical protein Mal4_12640 [Maioricimonas rarisocia]
MYTSPYPDRRHLASGAEQHFLSQMRYFSSSFTIAWPIASPIM